jgi:hypothetical protein
LTPDNPRAVSERQNGSQPARPIFGGGDLDAQDFAVALGVDTHRDQGVYVDHPAVLAHLEDQRVGGHKRIRAGVQGSGANASTAVSSSLAITDTCDLDNDVIPKVPTSLSIRRVETPSR